MAAVLEAVPANMHMSIQQARPATAAPPARAVTNVACRSQHPTRKTREPRRAASHRTRCPPTPPRA